jgi:hypothetical protein
MAGMVDDDDEAPGWGCKDGWDCCIALGLGGRELPAVGFCQSLFRFSLAQASLYVILGRVELRKRRNIHAGPVHMELQRLQGCALAAQRLHRVVRAVLKGCEPTRQVRTVTYHGYRRGCGGISGEEMCCLVVLRSGDCFVQRTENTEFRKIKSKQE